jgi:hypothetical protein
MHYWIIARGVYICLLRTKGKKHTKIRMKNYKLLNIVLGWAAFIVAMTTYTLTLEPTVSFWDCGEFISAAYRLQICHPPGAPLFLIIGRLFSLMANDVSEVAFWVNMVSGVTSALTVLFMFWTVTHLAKKVIAPKDEDLTATQTIGIMVSGLVAALALTFSDTFWFSAVEAEVYAFSSFFTTVTFWCILKWENIAHQKDSNRWLILISYLVGLAIGVHLLSILVIPAIVYVYYFKKYDFSRNGFIKASVVAIMAIALVQFGIIPGMPSLMTKFDYLFVNTLGMSFNSGIYAMMFTIVLFFVSLLHYTHTGSKATMYIATASLLFMAFTSFVINASLSGFLFWSIAAAGLYYSIFMNKVSKTLVNIFTLCVSFIIIGYSSYAMVLIRSNANTPIDMNNPENPFSLLSYLNREQYGDNPLVYGQYFYAKVIDLKKGDMQYAKGSDGKYKEVGAKVSRVFDTKDQTIFPRMWSDRPDHVQAYRQWEKIPEGKRATMGKNIDFLLSYQLGFMYWRYFFWNFVGRQNDEQGFGDVIRGNWMSGIDFIDKMRLGPQDNIPDSMKNNKARNTYFFLPLLLGIIGMVWHYRKSREDAIVVATLFLFTGFFIILYLNFPAHQPRERDYAYVGSYQTFIIWIGLGVLAIIDWLSRKMNKGVATGIASVATIAGVPLLMANQNWDDHNRADRFTALDFANNYLESCPPNAILFTNGDNDTYPLWYAQNVAGIRTDIRIINLSLLNTDWYTDNLKRKVYDSEIVPFSMTPDKYEQGTRDYVVYYNNPQIQQRYGIGENDYLPLKNVIQFINDDTDPLAKVQSQSGDSYNYFPTKKFYMLVDKEQVKKAGVVPEKDYDKIVDTMRWEVNRSNLMKADLVTLDIVASNDWTRPVCFAITTGSDVYLNMQDYFRINGLVYELVPIKNSQASEGTMGSLNTDIMYDNYMNKFKWGNMDKPGIYLDETILRQTNNMRNLAYRLGMRLVEEGDKKRAIEVLDKAVAMMPQENVPYNQLLLALAQTYYAADAPEKGDDLVKRVSTEYTQKHRYFSSFKGTNKYQQVSSEVDEANQILGYAVNIAQTNNRKELADELQKQFENTVAGK